MDQMDTRFEILFKLLPLLDNSTAVLPEVKILIFNTEKIQPKTNPIRPKTIPPHPYNWVQFLRSFNNAYHALIPDKFF